MTGPGSIAGPAGSHSRRTRFVRIGVLALTLGVSLGILTFRIYPLLLAAQLVLSGVSVLVGLEVILVGTFQALTGRLVPTKPWTSFLFGVHPPPTPPKAKQVRLLGGLLVLVGLLAFFTAATVWLSSP
jgi:hypothetical protein